MLSMIGPRSLRQSCSLMMRPSVEMDMDGATPTNQISTKSSKKVTAQHLRRFVLRRSPAQQSSEG